MRERRWTRAISQLAHRSARQARPGQMSADRRKRRGPGRARPSRAELGETGVLVPARQRGRRPRRGRRAGRLWTWGLRVPAPRAYRLRPRRSMFPNRVDARTCRVVRSRCREVSSLAIHPGAGPCGSPPLLNASRLGWRVIADASPRGRVVLGGERVAVSEEGERRAHDVPRSAAQGAHGGGGRCANHPARTEHGGVKKGGPDSASCFHRQGRQETPRRAGLGVSWRPWR